MKKAFIIALLTIQIGAFAQKSTMSGTDVLVAARNEQFKSVAFSAKYQKLFVTASSNKMMVLNADESLAKVMIFNGAGTVDLDQNSEHGAYSTDKTIYLFDQNSLTLIDSIPFSNVGQGATKVWFTQGAILVSTFKYVLVYNLAAHKLSVVATLYGILDYDYNSDKMLLGKWNDKSNYDRKVTEVYITTSESIISGVSDLEPVHTTDRSNELYSYLMDDATNVLSYDGKGNMYLTNLEYGATMTFIQDTIANTKKKVYGLAKISDDLFVQVKFDVLPITAENIETYNLKIGDKPSELVIKKSVNNEIVRWVMVRNGIVNNQIIVNPTNNNFYFITSGGNGNRLVSIK